MSKSATKWSDRIKTQRSPGIANDFVFDMLDELLSDSPYSQEYQPL
jgi:hypothetical protein